VPTSTGFWSTWESNPKHRASPRHAGHRCGKVKVRRRRGRVRRLSQTGSGQPITAGLPRRSAHCLVNLQQWVMGRDDCTGVGLCPSAARCVVCDYGAQILGDSDCHLRENPFYQDGLGCDTWPRAVGSPIRLAGLKFSVLNGQMRRFNPPFWALGPREPTARRHHVRL